MSPQKRVCDNCSEATALLYCRADSAKLCFLCDREIHSANQLFSKHTRSPLCDACDFSPASIFCSTESSVLCQNCDWERHNLSLSLVHNRRPLEGFTGCPSVSDLMAIVGFEEVGNKALFLSDENDDADEFSDFLVWDDASHVFNFDDLIGSTNSAHEFQAMGGPPLPLPKNRNAACGQYKEDILSQLREMAKSEPNSNHEAADAEPLINYRSLVPEQNVQPRHMCTGFAHDAEQIESPDFGAGDFQWFSDGGQAANQFCISNSFKRSYIEESPVVPEKHSDIGGSVSHANDGNEAQSLHVIISENSSALPKVSPHELNSQERDSALSRYKEKKKTRRYDKHIRYESRKVRAESRVRIKGRFAKMDH
ncbi:zinc finger protein CONSTANS-LIKE 13 [Juglans microcarpa x Juglans regia]|uniref:zinc finger protein CONSTANS-LIKE 13 n=1 Tax=Juglans microcarpa x Juglans regia TaxID=2249226 RepID=UPI001B7E45A8|nr:zinc finger protein CONSTANS-LIKE 13 [Juglans microcarpa x Juglans regia]